MRSDGVALALTALPVILTSALVRLPWSIAALPPPYRNFAAYAAANWVTFALVLRVVGVRRLRDDGLRFRPTVRGVAAALVAFVAGLCVYGAVGALLARLGLPPVRGMDFPSPTPLQAAVLVLGVVVTAAFCEEVFFRVLWIGVLRRRVPVWAAGLVSIAAFALIHYPYFGLGGVVFISVWAVLPLWLFVAFGELSAPLLMHALNNAFAYVVVPLVLRG
ncbi:MAG TPA: CPBP family intramembrane glutamic endopeptidase [Candidatus Binatia bacterium]|jgi:membrane protease YdiL (CAAX protease family)